MKRLKLFILSALCLAQLTGCSGPVQPENSDYDEPIRLNVVTSYGGDDGNRSHYEKAIADFEHYYDIDIQDQSDTSSEDWKSKVLSDFITGSEPDVLYYFVNADAEPFIKANKVVSIEEIQKEYPSYASNMKRSMLPAATDGQHYAVPSTGFWESLFVNEAVLSECGISLPGKDYTWDQFLADCEIIKANGFTPIACSLADVPHYWFEFCVMNNGSVRNHYQLPQLNDEGRLSYDSVSRKWIAGLSDMKLMYDKGYFPSNTLFATDGEAVSLFAEGKAAFLLDGSWKIGYLSENYPDHLSNYRLCFFPGKGARRATDAVGGISMGYFITQKAWENPTKRAAAVQFVTYMTSNEILSQFATTEITALTDGITEKKLNAIEQDAVQHLKHLTAITGAVQDLMSTESKKDLFSNIPDIMIGQMSPADAVKSALKLNG